MREQHYQIERILELLGTASSDLLFHLLAEHGVTPTSYRDAFAKAAEHDLLDAELSQRLQQAAGMRNVLAHLYEQIDLDLVHAAIGPALENFGRLVAELEPSLDDGE